MSHKPSKWRIFYVNTAVDFPGGPVVRSLPANAGDMGSIPGPGGFMCLKATKPISHNP